MRQPLWMPGALALCILFILSGCMVGPRYIPPCVPVQDHWIDVPNQYLSTECCESVCWWKALNDPLLDELIEIAYERNLTLEASGLQVYEAYASLGIAVGNFFPQFQDVQGSHTYTHQSTNIANANTLFKFKDYLFTFMAAWELDVWGKFRHGIEVGIANLDGTVLTYRQVLLTIIASVAQTYVNIAGNNAKIDVFNQNITLQQKTLDIVEAKFKLGEVGELDVQEARSNLNFTKALLDTQIIMKRQQENLLCVLLGVAPFRVNDCFPITSTIPTFPSTANVGVPINIVRTRPDVRAAEQAAIAQSNIVGIAETDLLPAFSLSGFFGWEAQDKSKLFDARSKFFQFRDAFAWRIFNYGRLTNNVRLQNTLLQQLMVNYQNIVISACLEVENSIIVFLENKQLTEDLTNAVIATAKAADLALEQYQNGVRDFLNVLVLQANLVTQQQALVDAKIDWTNSYIGIQRALGRGWEFAQDADVVSPEVKGEMHDRIRWVDLFW